MHQVWKVRGRRLAVLLAAFVMMSRSAVATYSCVAPFASQQVLFNTPHSNVMAAKLNPCELFVTNPAVSAGIYKVNMCTATLPIDVTIPNPSLTLLPGAGFDSRHAIAVVTNPTTGLPEIWVTNKFINAVERIDPLTGGVLASIPVTGYAIDGMSYAAGFRGYKVAVGGNTDILEVDLADLTAPYTISVIASGTGGVDHMSWDASTPRDHLYMAGVGGDALRLEATAPPPNVCVLSSGIPGIDGAAFLTGGAKLGSDVVWFHTNGGQVVQFDRLPLGSSTSCARPFTVPCSMDAPANRGDGVGAPGDGFVYLCSEFEVNRVDPPVHAPNTSIPAFLMPGGSPQANMYVAINAFGLQGCFRTEAVRDSLILRLNEGIEVYTAGNQQAGKAKLTSLLREIESGRGEITCQEAVDLLQLHLRSLISTL